MQRQCAAVDCLVRDDKIINLKAPHSVRIQPPRAEEEPLDGHQRFERQIVFALVHTKIKGVFCGTKGNRYLGPLVLCVSIEIIGSSCAVSRGETDGDLLSVDLEVEGGREVKQWRQFVGKRTNGERDEELCGEMEGKVRSDIEIVRSQECSRNIVSHLEGI